MSDILHTFLAICVIIGLTLLMTSWDSKRHTLVWSIDGSRHELKFGDQP